MKTKLIGKILRNKEFSEDEKIELIEKVLDKEHYYPVYPDWSPCYPVYPPIVYTTNAGTVTCQTNNSDNYLQLTII